MEVLKQVDELNKDIIEAQQERAKKIKYIEREDDPELKKMYIEEQKRFETMHEQLAGKIDGEIDMDMHGNVVFRKVGEEKPKEEETAGGIQGPGTYVLRDGKLVPGKGETREQA